MRIAFAGFRHPHIFDLYKRCRETVGVEIVACAEDDPVARDAAAQTAGISFSDASVDEMLQKADFDAVAVGDFYASRAGLIIKALKRGAHVISDKPFCTSLADLHVIEELCVAKGRCLGCMFDLRDAPFALGMRNALWNGMAGRVLSVDFRAQHPLLFGKRATWYFEDEKYGGIFNDIAIHACDLLPWLCNLPSGQTLSAYQWPTRRCGQDRFCDGGKCLFTLGDGVVVSGDVSYFSPDAFLYQMPSYWQITVNGTEGQLEGGCNLPVLTFYPQNQDRIQSIPLPPGQSGGYWQEFCQTVKRGCKEEMVHLTSRNIQAQKASLELQAAAHTLRRI